ncbi:unnamed protein product [Mytilus edulis]|uniref:Uncharacterized protein n=1 Tax=Mytilus edulis TaxID=6550 RepID=A0A8S3RTD9_MYTED|nr:unnamed protein product [Mytilus edulis]
MPKDVTDDKDITIITTSIGTSGLSAITVDQINNLDDTEFTDCIDILGAVTDYSTDQIDALVTVGKRNTVWGDPTTWTATTVYSAGVIVQGLTVSEIGTLALDLDAVSKLGEYDGWTDAQKNALFERWLTLEKSDDASTITSSKLRSCTANDIIIVKKKYIVFRLQNKLMFLKTTLWKYSQNI